ncbi:MAG: FecR domain-containing protein [Bacteroidales bacterium]|jgi:ferric-dicitrate binding protein FerR (iron transport regulator)
MKNGQTHIDQKLLVFYLLDEISQQGRGKVEAWLEASESNRLYFDGLKKTWEESGKIDPDGIRFDANRAWERMNGRIVKEREDVKSGEDGKNVKRVKRVVMNWGVRGALMAVAAVAVFMAVSVIFIKYLQNRQDSGMVTLASLSVPVQDTLTDGSTVVLNKETRLTIPKKFTSGSRKVELEGEAFFQVEHDARRPFIIDAGLGQVKVLGTSFQVKAYPDSDLEVYVESGRVELSIAGSVTGDTARLILKAGERGMIRTGSKEIVKPAAIGPDELFWANKKLIFQETRLSLVFDLLQEHYKADIEVKDAAILHCLLTATFTDETIDQILEVVAASFDLTLSKEVNKFIINGKGCGNEKE